VSSSSEILPEIREFERFSTTALNAYLQPEVSGYIDRLDRALTQGGFGGEFMIVQSNGGVMGTDTACRCRCARRCPARRPALSPPVTSR
jgi:N-methylhydantoinase A